MTTIQTLSLDQVQTLSSAAAKADDSELCEDCALVEQAYLDSSESDLSAMIDEERGEVRSAATRIVAAINDVYIVTFPATADVQFPDNGDRVHGTEGIEVR